LPLEPLSSLSLALYLEEFCQVYPLQQFSSSSPSSPLHTNIDLASSLHLLSSIVTFMTMFYLALTSTFPSLSDGMDTLLTSYRNYLHHTSLYLRRCCSPSSRPDTLLYTHLLRIKKLPGSYALELFENSRDHGDDDGKEEPPEYSENVLLRPLVGIDREALRALLLSSESPFAESQPEVEAVSAVSPSLPLPCGDMTSCPPLRHSNRKRSLSTILTRDFSG
jgi:hypothetical protein